MSFQYTYDANGKPVGVFVPIAEWNRITGETKNKRTRRTASKEKILLGIEKGLKQVKGIEKGKLKPVSLKQLMDAL